MLSACGCACLVSLILCAAGTLTNVICVLVRNICSVVTGVCPVTVMSFLSEFSVCLHSVVGPVCVCVCLWRVRVCLCVGCVAREMCPVCANCWL